MLVGVWCVGGVVSVLPYLCESLWFVVCGYFTQSAAIILLQSSFSVKVIFIQGK